MRSPFENLIRVLVPIIGLIGLGACGGKSGPPPPVDPNSPGSINATLNMKVGGATSINCTAPGVTWTASSPAGSTQTKTSNPIVTTDNVQSTCIAGIEGTTSCYCPVSMSFFSLAHGTWNVAASGASCSVTVNAGQTATATLFTDGTPCTKFP